jgi:hypothetical protein
MILSISPFTVMAIFSVLLALLLIGIVVYGYCIVAKMDKPNFYSK